MILLYTFVKLLSNASPSAQPRSGYTLPVFACASAIAALRWLQEDLSGLASVTVDLIEPAEVVEIAIEQVARLTSHSALAITRSDPGDNLDLTRDTPIWAWVEVREGDSRQEVDQPIHGEAAAIPILIQGGEGIGRLVNVDNQAAIYRYAQRLIQENLQRWVQPGQEVQITIILPEGRLLAERTSNSAFGVVEGLSLLGTSGIAQPLSAPGQLEQFRQSLRQQADQHDCLVFCVGENGLDLAKQLGIKADRLVKTANWLGSMLVEAGLQGVNSILLFGYHGKLIKLAGGIFHTHHYVADGRQEILAAHCANLKLPSHDLQTIFASATTEAALQHLRTLDTTTGSHWVTAVYRAIVQQIDQRSTAYIHAHTGRAVQVGSILFDRDRQIIWQSEIGASLLTQVC